MDELRGRCLACGAELVEETTAEQHGCSMELITVVKHRGPIEPACRLVLEAYMDEQRRILAETIQRSIEQFRGGA